jgi:predicted RNase H-like nuclease (RuvC/YqgF family)
MVACISPVFTAYEETANTLKYASRARNIKKKVRVNQREVEMHVYEYKNIIENLQKEIGALQAQINLQDENNQFQKKNFVQETNRLQESKVLEQNIDEISQKIFKNLEEFWEISTTL